MREQRLTQTELVFAKMELARRRGKTFRLSLHDLNLLHCTHLGEVMSECADLAMQPSGRTALNPPAREGEGDQP